MQATVESSSFPFLGGIGRFVPNPRLCDLITGHHTRLTDVLRHEWAHALADRRPRLVEGRRFRSVFGGACHMQGPVREYHPDHHLTRYAATQPCEDFAETFHFYLRHKGRLPVRLQAKPAIAANGSSWSGWRGGFRDLCRMMRTGDILQACFRSKCVQASCHARDGRHISA